MDSLDLISWLLLTNFLLSPYYCFWWTPWRWSHHCFWCMVESYYCFCDGLIWHHLATAFGALPGPRLITTFDELLGPHWFLFTASFFSLPPKKFQFFSPPSFLPPSWMCQKFSLRSFSPRDFRHSSFNTNIFNFFFPAPFSPQINQKSFRHPTLLWKKTRHPPFSPKKGGWR